MKIRLGVLLAVLGFACVSKADVTFVFDQPYSGGLAWNFLNAASAPTSGLQWGVIIDTAGNGFANSSANYDAYTPGSATAGYLSVGGSVTDDYYIPGGTTSDGPIGLEDKNHVAPGPGLIGGMTATLPVALSPNSTFAIVWFSTSSTANGSKYGFLTDASFIPPAEGDVGDYDAYFINNNPVRPAIKTFGVVVTNPQISVFDGNGTGGNLRSDNTGTFGFPSTVINTSSSAQTFTIENTGAANLTGIAVTNAGTNNAGDFTINTSGTATTLAPNATTSFTVTFSPSALASRTAQVLIASNDPATSSFRLNVGGTGIAASIPQISLFDGSVAGTNPRLNDATALAFLPTQKSNTSAAQTFTIQNTGTADLNNIVVTKLGANPGDFTFSTTGMANTLVPGASTSFTVTFEPQETGSLAAVFQVASNDPATSNFKINVSGFGATEAGPQIAVQANGNAVVDSGLVKFTPAVSGGVQTFILQNIGTSNLTGLGVTQTLTGQPADFVLHTTGLATTLAPNATTTFSVNFLPGATSVGLRTTALVISSNSTSFGTFHVTMTGQTHAVSFDTASKTQIEHAVTVTVPVRLSSLKGYGTAFTVPLTFGGTAVNKVNYNHSPVSATGSSAATLSFGATQTVANITLTLIDDKVVTANTTVIITLGTPSAVGVGLGAISTYTLTIQDADTAPQITVPPVSQIVYLNDPVSFSSTVTGSDPLTLVWKKNGVAVAGATSNTLNLTGAAALTHAAAYSLTATNYKSTVTSTVQLAVVDHSSHTLRYNPGSIATLTASAAGNSVTYRWQKNGSDLPLTGTKYAGAATKTLTIKTLDGNDSADYTCNITAPGGTKSSGTFTVQVPTTSPTPRTPAFPDSVVNNVYSYQLPYDTTASQVPTKFVCLGLPKGLTCNATTGLITGTPTVASLIPYAVTVTLSNGVGPASNTFGSITVSAFPTACVGTYVGLMPRDATLNGKLGGRVDITTTATGSYTCNLKLGGSPYILTGTMVTAPPVSGQPLPSPHLSRTVVYAGQTVAVNLDLATIGDTFTFTVALPANSGSAPVFSGWRNVWHTAAPALSPAQVGTHAFNLATATAAPITVPQGFGYGTIVVNTSGGTTVSGRTADGGVITCGAVLSPDGDVVVFQPLYSNKGSLLGTVAIGTDPGHTITTTALDWQKTATVIARDYGAFGPVNLTMTGSQYHSAAPVLGLTVPLAGDDAKLVFDQGGLPANSVIDPDVQIRISAANVVTIATVPVTNPNAGKITKVTLNALTGAFSGTFTLKDGTVTRTVAFQGQIISGLDKGYGYFLLPQLANPSAVPPTTSANSPILSGSVVLQPFP